MIRRSHDLRNLRGDLVECKRLYMHDERLRTHPVWCSKEPTCVYKLSNTKTIMIYELCVIPLLKHFEIHAATFAASKEVFQSPSVVSNSQ